MIIFAVDASAAAGSAAVYRDGKLIYEAFANEGLTHSETLLVRCDEAFKAAGVKPADVDLYAVTAGPGSFTGLRIGMGLVKGFAFTNNTPCAAVPTLEALAQHACGEAGGKTVLTVMDARQRRVYLAAFAVKNGELVRVLEDQIVPVADIAGLLEEKGIGDLLVVGDKKDAVAEALGDRATAADDRFSDVHAAAAAAVADRMQQRGETVSGEQLRPSYLQLSQAERNRLEGKI